ncbi:MAG TPA: glycosyltransferase [Candidatus Deferrimicrobium sp.]|nr:glycosyltransferase [Candidatus Deferrimicrobium sp.]
MIKNNVQYKNNRAEETILKPGVSVVVCCYNSAGVIIPTIKSLSVQHVPPGAAYEVILVDNNCTDDTVPLAQNAWNNPAIPLRIVKEPQPGLIYARKTGVFQAGYQILLFVDDDNILEPDWIERLVEMYSQWPDVGAIGGYNEPLFDGEEEGEWNRPAWFKEFSSIYACTPKNTNPGVSVFKQTLFGAGLSVRTQAVRDLFASPLPLFLVGRTQDTLHRGDDSEICLRLGLMGWKLWYEKNLKLKHYILRHRVNWDYVLQARKGGGHADIILKLYRDLLDGKPPLNYSDLSIYISSLWQEFWQLRRKNKDLALLNKEGKSICLRYHYLQGLTEGFSKMDREEYNTARVKISTYFGYKETRSFLFRQRYKRFLSKFIN